MHCVRLAVFVVWPRRLLSRFISSQFYRPDQFNFDHVNCIRPTRPNATAPRPCRIRLVLFAGFHAMENVAMNNSRHKRACSSNGNRIRGLWGAGPKKRVALLGNRRRRSHHFLLRALCCIDVIDVSQSSNIQHAALLYTISTRQF